jgi:N-Acetylglucosaminyltransferase-IV (GnT-IV) conserved region
MRLLNLSITPQLVHRYIIASFICLYLLAFQYCRTNFYTDPTSVFFDPIRGYDQVYSKFRTSQAINFVRQTDEIIAIPINNKNVLSTNTSATFCLGIASIAREISYVEATIGSLLLDLTAKERSDIHLVVFIPHSDPTVHPSYSSTWMSVLPDTVLLYDLPKNKLEYIKHLETEDSTSKEKGISDYAYLLKACHSIGSPYVIIIEDDVIAVDGWYHRTLQALKDAEEQTRRIGATNCSCPLFLFGLRDF